MNAQSTVDAVPRVPRSIVLARLLWRCAFCLFAVLAGDAVLVAVPQAREALQAALAPRDGQALGWHQLPFVAAFVYWSVSAWLVARLLLSRRFERDALGVRRADAYVNWLAAVLPRVFAALALLPVTLLTAQINPALGLVTGACAVAILGGLVLRSRFGDVTERNSYGAFAFMGPQSRQAVWAFMALGATLMAGLWHRPAGAVLAVLWAAGAAGLWAWDARRDWPGVDEAQSRSLRDEARRSWALPLLSALAAATLLVLSMQADDEVHLARRLGSPALLLFALGGWTMFGGFVLTYLPLSWRWVGLAPWLPPLLLLLWSGRETHLVAQRDPPPAAQAAAPQAADAPRETASERFARWIAGSPAGEPIYLVAAAGGASRAAYWTGSVLAELEDAARRAGRPFAANLFAISSISGSSLGATAFVAALAQPSAPACGPGPAAADRCLAAPLQAFLERDFLAPVVGRMLFPDLFTRFVPVPQFLAARADRSLGLEEAWAGDWRKQFGGGVGVVDWHAPIAALYQQAERDGPPRLPLLLLNTVRLDDGQRFMQSVVRPDWPGMKDLHDPAFDTRRLSLAQAVHNSARFPYVSPAGLLLGAPDPAAPRTEPRAELGRLGDGGYHEGSGAATLADLIEHLMARGLLRAQPGRPGLWGCPGGWAGAGSEVACPGARPVVGIILDNTPSRYPHDFVRDLDGRALGEPPGLAPGDMFWPEALAPVFGGLSTRTQLAHLAQRRLSRLLGPAPSSLIELRVPLWRRLADDESTAQACRGSRVQPSMNWYLDACSRARLGQAARVRPDAAARSSLAEQALLNHLQRLRQQVEASAARPAEGAR